MTRFFLTTVLFVRYRTKKAQPQLCLFFYCPVTANSLHGFLSILNNKSNFTEFVDIYNHLAALG